MYIYENMFTLQELAVARHSLYEQLCDKGSFFNQEPGIHVQLNRSHVSIFVVRCIVVV